MKRPILTMPAVLLLLVLLVVAPSVVMGYQHIRNADAIAVDYQGSTPWYDSGLIYAAQQYELAAQRLPWRPDLWDRAGDIYAVADRLDEMLAAYENAKEKNTLGPCGWEMLGSFSDDPLATWKEGLLYYPDHVVLYINIAREYHLLGDFDLERQYLLDALNYEESAPGCDFNTVYFPYVHYRVGILMMLDDPSRALDELNTAARADVQFAPVVETLRTTLNLASLESDPAQALILIGRGLALAEEWQLAASAFDNATQADPESASAWAWLGQAQYQLGEDALGSFEKAESINPADPILLSLRGLYWQQQNDFESALHDFEILAQLEPKNPTWQTSLGALYAELGDLPTALAAYEKAVELAPTESLYRQLLALFSFNYQFDLAQTGLSAARRAVILSPDEAQYSDTLGLVYFGLRRDEDAERQLLHTLDLDAEYAPAHLHLGMLYLQRGHRDLAYASLSRARELSPNGTAGADAARLLAEFFQE